MAHAVGSVRYSVHVTSNVSPRSKPSAIRHWLDSDSLDTAEYPCGC